LEKLKEKKLEIYHKEEQKAEEALVEEFVSFSRIAAK
jgi:flagellar FliJ protein